MQKLVQIFCITMLSFTALSTIINVQGAKADDIYDKCYKFDRLLNEEELEYCRSVTSHQFDNTNERMYLNTGEYCVNDVEYRSIFDSNMQCWNQLYLQEKLRREERKHK
jgi:hypothetical protein